MQKQHLSQRVRVGRRDPRPPDRDLEPLAPRSIRWRCIAATSGAQLGRRLQLSPATRDPAAPPRPPDGLFCSLSSKPPRRSPSVTRPQSMLVGGFVREHAISSRAQKPDLWRAALCEHRDSRHAHRACVGRLCASTRLSHARRKAGCGVCSRVATTTIGPAEQWVVPGYSFRPEVR